MAERRMFAKSIVLSDAFLDMPLSARCLYFTLGMMADDDGFVGSPKAIMRQCGASQDDMAVLLQKRYVLGFESGVIVIKHWRMNNYLQSDRKKNTTYVEELETLMIDEKGAYTEREKDMYTKCIQNVYTGKDSIGKDRLGKDSVVTPKDRASNLSNYNHLKETEKDEYITYIVNHTELDDAVCLWMQYKDEKKPHSQNHYADTGMVSLLKKIYKMALDYGVAPVIDTIETSMGNNYQGIVWDRMQKQTKSQTLADKWGLNNDT